MCHKLLIIGIILIGLSSCISALKLNSNGGYDITIAVHEDAEVRDADYIESLKGILRTFSIKLFAASKGHFFLRSVEILLPSTWNVLSESPNSQDFTQSADATTQSFQTADFRLSDSIRRPFVENPNICGRSGEFISFPTNFFQANNGKYGQTWKALLNQWAIYRLGVWEEHGYPGDENFPYFHKEKPNSATWSTTGCSNIPIKGKYVNKDGYTDEEKCDIYSADGPIAECRFEPFHSGNDGVSSSLMHFQFLESISDFCDETNHVRTAPTKQNLFCGYRSVWEVIRQTQDFQAVSDPISGSIPNVKFETKFTSIQPILYVLVDQGYSSVPRFVEKLKNQAAKLFEVANIQNTIASLGTFPPIDGQFVDERVRWKALGSGREEFTQALTETQTSPQEFRDFGQAILTAIEIIAKKNTAGGAVLFVIKTGAGNNTFDDIAYEEEIHGALLGAQIKLVVLEGQESRTAPYVNLKSLTQRVNGIHVLSNSSNIDDFTIIGDLIGEIENLLRGSISKINNSVLIYKGFVEPALDFEIFYPPNITTVSFSLTVPDCAKVAIGLPDVVLLPIRSEWDEKVDLLRRKVLSGYLPVGGDSLSVGGLFNFAYLADPNNCSDGSGQLIIYGDLTQNSYHHELGVSVFTSGVNGIVDFNQTGDSDAPFSIFARVNVKGVPIANLSIEAQIQKTGDKLNETWILKLSDDGFGAPDLLKNDGLYSATFIPPENGFYTLSLNVQNRQVATDPLIRLVPINQTQLECSRLECNAVSLSTYFGISKDLQDGVSIVNRDLFIPGRPTKINTLEVYTDSNYEIQVQFNSPAFIGTGNDGTITYFAYLADTLEDLLGDLDSPNVTRIVLASEISASPPGTLEMFEIQYSGESDVVYLTVQTVHENLQSAISNIRGIFLDSGNTTEPTKEPSTTESVTTYVSTSTPMPTSETTEAEESTPPKPSESPEETSTTDLTSETDDLELNSTISTSTEETTSPFDPTTTTEENNGGEEEDEDGFFSTTWGIVVIIVAILLILTAIGGILLLYYRWRRKDYATRDTKLSSSFNFLNRNSSPVETLSRTSRISD